MANFHSRSNSFPSQSNPVMDDVHDQLCRLKSSHNASTSICANLASLGELHQGINNLIQMPSIQQVLSNEEAQIWMNELLEGSIRLMDLCGFSKDVVRQAKESVQELESSIRRSRGETDHINAYMASRKKMIKMVKKYIKNARSSNQNEAAQPQIGAVLKETESLDFSVLKSVLVLLSGEKERSSWSFLTKLTQTNRVYSEVEQELGGDDLCSLNFHKSMDANSMLKQLTASEMMIQELEEGLESLFRSLLKTRVSLLNVLSHYPLSWLVHANF